MAHFSLHGRLPFPRDTVQSRLAENKRYHDGLLDTDSLLTGSSHQGPLSPGQSILGPVHVHQSPCELVTMSLKKSGITCGLGSLEVKDTHNDSRLDYHSCFALHSPGPKLLAAMDFAQERLGSYIMLQ